MNAITLMHEIAALAGYTIDASTGQDPANKLRALRRLNSIKADIVSRYGGKWKANYREGWLPLVTPITVNQVQFVQGSCQVFVPQPFYLAGLVPGQKILGADNAYYKISALQAGGTNTFLLSQPYQGPSTITNPVTTQVWQDEYVLFPDVLSVGGFIDYLLPERATETWPSNMKESYPFPITIDEPTLYTVIQRQIYSAVQKAGTINCTQNSNVWTGVGTSFMGGANVGAVANPNIYPGYILTVNGVNYTVLTVDSDTQLTTCQLAVSTLSGVFYSAIGKNAQIVRFKQPTTQRIVHYWYYSKDFPLVNDNDEDWICELYPEVILAGAVLKDYLDKNDVARASLSKQTYEDFIKNMKVADEGSYTGIRTLGIFVPPEARE